MGLLKKTFYALEVIKHKRPIRVNFKCLRVNNKSITIYYSFKDKVLSSSEFFILEDLYTHLSILKFSKSVEYILLELLGAYKLLKRSSKVNNENLGTLIAAYASQL